MDVSEFIDDDSFVENDEKDEYASVEYKGDGDDGDDDDNEEQ